MDGSRLVETTPGTARFVVVTFDPRASVKESPERGEEPSTVRVEVTVEEAATNPPSSCRVAVAEDPRAGDGARVSDSDEEKAGQPVPSARQRRPAPSRSRSRTSRRGRIRKTRKPSRSRTTWSRSRSRTRARRPRPRPGGSGRRGWSRWVFVPVAFVQTRLANEDGAEPVRTREVAVTDPKLAEVEETVPNWAFWANRLVVVTGSPSRP